VNPFPWLFRQPANLRVWRSATKLLVKTKTERILHVLEMENKRMAFHNTANQRIRMVTSRILALAGSMAACFFYVFVGSERGYAQEIKVRLTLTGLGHSGIGMLLAFSPDGKKLAYGSSEWGVGLWDLAGGKQKRKLSSKGEDLIFPTCCIVFSPNGKVIALGSHWGIHLLEVASGKKIGVLTTKSHPNIDYLAISSDGKSLAAGRGHEREVFLWDLNTQKLRTKLPRHPGHPGSVGSPVFSPDGKILATSGFFENIYLWRADTGKPCGRLKERPLRNRKYHPTWHLAFTPDGKSLVAAGPEGRVDIWDLATGKAICLNSQMYIQGMAMSPDGRTLAFVGSTIHLFDLLARKERAVLKSPARTDYCPVVAFSPDGRTLAAGRHDFLSAEPYDGNVVLFDLASVKGVKTPVTAELGRLWKRLGSSDAPDAYRAIRILSAFPRQAVPFLRQHMRPLPPPTAAQLAAGARYVPDLDSDDFATRQKAYEELRKAGACAEDALRRALAGRPSPEVRKKAQSLLGRIVSTRTARPLQRHRVLEVLEHMDDADARALLAELAKNAPEALIRQEAKDSLARVRKRPPPTIIKPLPPNAAARPKAAPPTRR
jgi:WD40 repeat protein